MALVSQIIKAASKFIPKISKVVPKVTPKVVPKVLPKIKPSAVSKFKDIVSKGHTKRIIGSSAARNRAIQNVDDFYLKEIKSLKNTYRQTNKATTETIKQLQKPLKPGGSSFVRKELALDRARMLRDYKGQLKNAFKPARQELRALIKERKIANKFLKNNYKNIVKDTIKRTRIMRNAAAQTRLKSFNAGGQYIRPKLLKDTIKQELKDTGVWRKGVGVDDMLANEKLLKNLTKANPKGRIDAINKTRNLREAISIDVHELTHSVQHNLTKALQKYLEKSTNLGYTHHLRKYGSRFNAFGTGRRNPLYNTIDDIINKAGNLSTRHTRANSPIVSLAKRLQREGIIPRNLKPNQLNYSNLHEAMINVRGGFANPTSTMYKGPGTFRRLFPGGEKQFKNVQSEILKMMDLRRGNWGDIPGYFKRLHEVGARLNEIRWIPGLENLLKKVVSQGPKGRKQLKVLAEKYPEIGELLRVVPERRLPQLLKDAWMGVPGLPMLDYLNEDK